MNKFIRNLVLISATLLSTNLIAGTLEDKYKEETCGLTEEGYIDTTSDDICYEDSRARIKALVNYTIIETGAFEDTQFKRYFNEKISTHEHSHLKERPENLHQTTSTLSMKVFFSILIFTSMFSMLFILFKFTGSADFKEYSLVKEISVKILAIFFLTPVPSNNMPVISNIFNEFTAYNLKHDNVSARKTIDATYRTYKGDITTNKTEISKKNVEQSVVDTMLWAYAGIRQTDKFYNEFIDTKMGTLGYSMSSAVNIKDDSIVFRREINGLNKYIGGTINKYNVSGSDIKTLKKLGLEKYITEDSSSWKSNVELIENEISNKLKKDKLGAEEIKSVNTVLKLSYNKALDNLVTEIWNGEDLHNMFTKSLEIACTLNAGGEQAKNYIKYLNGESANNYSSQCVEQKNGQLVALGLDAKIEDMNEKSKYSFELQQKNNQFIIDKKRALTDKFNELRFNFASAYSAITKSNSEKEFLRYSAANPSYMQYFANTNLAKLNFNNDTEIKSILNNGLFTARNNANSNMIIETVLLSYPQIEALISSGLDIKIRKNISDVIHENNNLKRLKVDTGNKGSGNVADNIEENFIDLPFRKGLKDFKETTSELYSNIENGNNTFISMIYFAEKIKTSSWDLIADSAGVVALNQAKNYFSKKHEARKSKTATIKGDKSSSKKMTTTALSAFASIAGVLSSLVILVLTPILIFATFIADFMPMIFNLPFFLALLAYDINVSLIVQIAVVIFVLARFTIPNDNNNIADIFKRFINFPIAIMLFPLMLYFSYVMSTITFEILTSTFVEIFIKTLFPMSTYSFMSFDSILNIVVMFITLIWLLVMSLTTSLALSANVMNTLFKAMGVPELFSTTFENYTNTLNTIFLKIIPFGTLLFGALYKIEISPFIKSVKNKIKDSGMYKKITGVFK